MALQYVRDESGRIKFDEETGHPLVFDDVRGDGKENSFALDGISLYRKLPIKLKKVKKSRRKVKRLKAMIEVRELIIAYEVKIANVEKTYKAKIAEANKKLLKKEKQLDRLHNNIIV